MENKRHILVVDDEETLCEALRFSLEAEGYAVDVAYSSEEALALELPTFDLILLDIMMGEISGTQLARILKSKPDTANIPIIFCTAKDTEEDMIKGLDLGADDYITKPYSLNTVSARVRAVLRRADNPIATPPQKTDKVIKFEGLTLYPEMKLCRIDGEELRLPRKEFEILTALLTHRGRIYSREELLRAIWPEEVVVLNRVVDVNIRRIRQKIGKYGKHIVTRSGYGYGFMD